MRLSLASGALVVVVVAEVSRVLEAFSGLHATVPRQSGVACYTKSVRGQR